MAPKLRWTLLCLAPFLACNAADLDGLSAPDATPRDGGRGELGPADAAPRDAGPPDLSPPDLGEPDAGAVTCSGSLRVGIIPEIRGRAENFEGPMVWAETDALRLRSMDSRTTVVLDNVRDLPRGLFEFQAFYARLEVYQPFWTEVRMTLWTWTGRGPGRLLFIGWSGSRFDAGDPAVFDYRYEPLGCPLADPTGICGDTEGLGLVVGDRVVNYGSRDEGRPLLANGASRRFLQPPTCTDTPNQWVEGWIWAGDDVHCASMGRDACIADPACVLWGSETQDPRYVCAPARSDCERVTNEDECTARSTCTFDRGDCYCPEGVRCACAGGPAPKCRSGCGTMQTGACPSDQYCEILTYEGPQCALPPNGGGWCTRSPTSCEGTLEQEVCACTGAGSSRYANDCLRRRSGAGRADPMVCP